MVRVEVVSLLTPWHKIPVESFLSVSTSNESLNFKTNYSHNYPGKQDKIYQKLWRNKRLGKATLG